MSEEHEQSQAKRIFYKREPLCVPLLPVGGLLGLGLLVARFPVLFVLVALVTF